MQPSIDTPVVVVGAGPAGLATAAALAMAACPAVVIEKAPTVGAAWRSHYARLHLHTVKSHSALPGMPFPESAPRYVARAGVVDYLERYAARFAPGVRLGEEVVAIRRDGDAWLTLSRTPAAEGGGERRTRSRYVVVAGGANAVPVRPPLPGEEAFEGQVLHSRDYRDPAPFAGRRVLVVGMGNTGAEIALDLAEHGVACGLSVRSPVNIVLRDVLGRPTQLSALALSRLPLRLGDALAKLLRDLSVGDLSRYGIRTPPTSPLADLRERGRTPMIDVGTLAKIRAGEIAVHPGIERLETGRVRFVDATSAAYDTIVLATGYRAAAAELFPDVRVPVGDSGLPAVTVGEEGLEGVFFVGFDTRRAGGLLRTIATQATEVAERIVAALPGGPRRQDAEAASA